MQKTRPKFKPKDGQIDYTNARWAPVINCVLKHKGKILLMQRSSELNFYPNYWNGISGFLDDSRDFGQKVKDEIQEEAGIDSKEIESIRLGEIFHQEAPEYKKTWIIHPVFVEVNTDKVIPDWETQDYKWIEPAEAKNYNLLPSFDTVLDKLSHWI
ncbi:MAG: NUDIX domain-containing protein [Candidatus Pacebacteria bacterium]|jgi:isopentenyldiphosphate isomerase|nr:NUDIX domain-containing protein [Candidatus Paceibacterota bacterium]|tara:strand:+ start:59713 stop:60180 length:468 start_codon:yes stop_codon:yes gene_type:complete